MPRHALAVALRLANEMRREKGNVGTDDRFDKVKNGIRHGPAEKFGVHEVRDIHGFRTNI